MLKEAIEKIVSLADPHVYEIGEEMYTNDKMTRIDPHIDRPNGINFSSLDGIKQAVREEIDRSEIEKPLFISVTSEVSVSVFTTLRRDNLKRDVLYIADAVLPSEPPKWSPHEDAMIALRSQYVQNEGSEYLLSLLSNISDDNSVKSEDNGMTQTVTSRAGVALAAKVAVKPIVALRPYRTFLEVEQPESDFLVRMKPGDKEKGIQAIIGIIEADGGAWKIKARAAIAEYFRAAFSGEIDRHSVVVVE